MSRDGQATWLAWEDHPRPWIFVEPIESISITQYHIQAEFRAMVLGSYDCNILPETPGLFSFATSSKAYLVLIECLAEAFCVFRMSITRPPKPSRQFFETFAETNVTFIDSFPGGQTVILPAFRIRYP